MNFRLKVQCKCSQALSLGSQSRLSVSAVCKAAQAISLGYQSPQYDRQPRPSVCNIWYTAQALGPQYVRQPRPSV